MTKQRTTRHGRVAGSALGGVMASAILLSGCSAGTSTSLPTQSLQQPGSSSATTTTNGSSSSVSDTAKADDAATKAARVGLFVTGTPAKTPAYAHVWATVLKVELLDDKDTQQAVWDGGVDGATIDLAALAGDGTGILPTNRFLALTGLPITTSKATQRVRITFGKALELYAPGTSTSQTTLLADNLPRDAEGRPVVSYVLAKPRDLSSGKQNLVIDFDLGKLGVTDGKATPAIRDGSTDGLADASRQVPTTFAGTVSGIADADKGGTKFVLTPDTIGLNTQIVLSTTGTALYNDDATPSPALAEKKRALITGTLDPTTERVVATEIALYAPDKSSSATADKTTGGSATSSSSAGATITGAISHVKGDDRTFVVDASQIVGIDPTMGAITVTVAPEAVLRSRGGLLLTNDDFWAALTAKGDTPLARVSGTYDPVTGTLTATRAKLENLSPSSTHEADVEGAPKFVDIAAHTFTIAAPLVQWEGIAAPGDKSKGIPVSVTSATAFKDQNGATVAQPNFFDAALGAKDKVVRVIGLYSKGELIATRIELLSAPSPTASPSATAVAAATAPASAAPTNTITVPTATVNAALNAAAAAVSAAAAKGTTTAPAANVPAATPATPAAPSASPTN